MANIRIYELARELALSNKQILGFCKELGIEGKRSHSNSLNDYEADKIRRHVLRETFEGGVIRRHKGESSSKNKSRIVIRRKKKVEEQPEGVSTEDAYKGDIVESPKTHETIEESASVDVFSEGEKNAVEKTITAKEDVVSDEEESQIEVLKEEESLEEVRKRHDVRAPKVLGKIELVKKEFQKSEKISRKGEQENLFEDDGDFPPDEDYSKRLKKGKYKKKRKQVLKRADLRDYDSERDLWKRERPKKKKNKEEKSASEAAPTKASKLVVKVDSEITVGDLARQMGIKAGEVIKGLMDLGLTATVNQFVDLDTATLVASEFGFSVQSIGHVEEDFIEQLKSEDKDEDLEKRPPVVTVMGHVDHGKTSLLDAIRKTSVTEKEAGGITQHIGAYRVSVGDSFVTFIDTPGHEAFTAMRSRGAQVTDVVVLVVAADDGVMPQTIEAINHAKAAESSIVVAINKIDKSDANPDKIRQQLAEHDLVSEEWGGNVIMVPVSAHTGEGLDVLLENLILQSEILELKANPCRNALGSVIESRLDKGRGPVMTVLIQNGKLKKGDSFIAGTVWGKVRALIDENGNSLTEAGPSMPVEVLGSNGTAGAGDEFFVLDSESESRRVSEIRVTRERTKVLASKGNKIQHLTLETFSQMVGKNEMQELPLIIKADVEGSVEAVSGSLEKLGDDQVKIKILHKATGGITENDVQLAMASNAIIIGFNVRADSSAATLAEQESVNIIYSRVIYELVELIEKALLGFLEPEIKEKMLGRVEVRETFKVPKLGTIAGAYVIDGIIIRGANLRLLRDNKIIFEGKMASLKRFKDDVKEVQAGYECGVGIEGYSDIQHGDIIEAYIVEEVAQSGFN